MDQLSDVGSELDEEKKLRYFNLTRTRHENRKGDEGFGHIVDMIVDFAMDVVELALNAVGAVLETVAVLTEEVIRGIAFVLDTIAEGCMQIYEKYEIAKAERAINNEINAVEEGNKILGNSTVTVTEEMRDKAARDILGFKEDRALNDHEQHEVKEISEYILTGIEGQDSNQIEGSEPVVDTKVFLEAKREVKVEELKRGFEERRNKFDLKKMVTNQPRKNYSERWGVEQEKAHVQERGEAIKERVTGKRYTEGAKDAVEKAPEAIRAAGSVVGEKASKAGSAVSAAGRAAKTGAQSFVDKVKAARGSGQGQSSER